MTTQPAVTASPGLRERKKQATRLALHQAALELARDTEDPAAVTVEAIAERAGVSERTFFNYYPSKEAAFAGLDPDLLDGLAERLRERPAGESAGAAVLAVLEEHVREHARDRAWWELRTDVARRSPEVAALVMGASARTDRVLVLAALERAGLTAAEAPLDLYVEVFGAIAAFRAGMWFHRTHGHDGHPVEAVREAHDRLRGPEERAAG